MRVGLPAFKKWEINDILKSRGGYAPATTKHNRYTNPPNPKLNPITKPTTNPTNSSHKS